MATRPSPLQQEFTPQDVSYQAAMIPKDESILRAAEERAGYVHLKPVPTKIANSRDKVIPGAVFRLYALFDRSGNLRNSISDEQLKEFKTLPFNWEKTPEERQKAKLKFFEDYCVTIPANGKIYDLSKEDDKLEYLFVLDYGMVAKDLASITSESLFYVQDEVKEAQAANSKARQSYKAREILYKMTGTQMIEFLSLYGHETKNATVDIAEQKLTEEIDKNPDRFIRLNEQSARTQDMIDINLALEYRIFTKDGSVLYFQSMLLGHNMEEAIKELNKPQNQKMKIQVRAMIEECKKTGKIYTGQ